MFGKKTRLCHHEPVRYEVMSPCCCTWVTQGVTPASRIWVAAPWSKSKKALEHFGKPEGHHQLLFHPIVAASYCMDLHVGWWQSEKKYCAFARHPATRRTCLGLLQHETDAKVRPGVQCGTCAGISRFPVVPLHFPNYGNHWNLPNINVVAAEWQSGTPAGYQMSTRDDRALQALWRLCWLSLWGTLGCDHVSGSVGFFPLDI